MEDFVEGHDEKTYEVYGEDKPTLDMGKLDDLMEENYRKIYDSGKNSPILGEHEEIVENIPNQDEYVHLFRDSQRRGIDVEGDGQIDGYDTNGDGIIDEYMEYQETYKKKYGENTIILIQVGSFFELYSVYENCSFMYKIGDICNIQISRKNKAIKEIGKNNPLMAGFPLYTLNKYVQILVQNNFTVVLIEQITPPPNPQRKITEIVSPSTNINITSRKSNYVMVFYFEVINEILVVGISGVDLTTGQSFIYENGASKLDPQYTLDECYRLLTSYNPTEVLLIGEDDINENQRIIVIVDIHGDIKRFKTILKDCMIINDNFEWVANPSNTIVVQLGDQVDSLNRNTNENWEVLNDYEMIYFTEHLNNIAKIKGGRCISLIGNHELMNVQGDMRYVSYQGIIGFGDKDIENSEKKRKISKEYRASSRLNS